MILFKVTLFSPICPVTHSRLQRIKSFYGRKKKKKFPVWLSNNTSPLICPYTVILDTHKINDCVSYTRSHIYRKGNSSVELLLERREVEVRTPFKHSGVGDFLLNSILTMVWKAAVKKKEKNKLWYWGEKKKYIQIKLSSHNLLCSNKPNTCMNLLNVFLVVRGKS